MTSFQLKLILFSALTAVSSALVKTLPTSKLVQPPGREAVAKTGDRGGRAGDGMNIEILSGEEGRGIERSVTRDDIRRSLSGIAPYSSPGTPPTRGLGGEEPWDIVVLKKRVDYVLNHLSGRERVDAIQKLAARTSSGNLSVLLAFLQTIDDADAQHLFVKAMVNFFLSSNSQEIVDWAEAIDEKSQKRRVYYEIGMKWSAIDLERSLAWAENLAESAGKIEAFEGIAWTWAQENPESAYDWAIQVEDPVIRDKVLVKISKILTLENPITAAQWAVKFPEGQARDEALNYAVFRWASSDYQSAAAWASEISDTDLRDKLFVAIAHSWSHSDPRRASEWAELFPDKDARRSALLSTSGRWANQDPEAAIHWAENFVEGETQKTVVSHIIEVWALENARDTVQRVQLIVDKSFRELGLLTVAKAWLSKDRAAAKQWVTTSSLSSEQKDHLLQYY